MAARILISDDLSQAGIEILRRGGLEVEVRTGLKPEALRSIIGDFDGLVIRSATKVDAELLAAAPRLRVVGRAGVGIDNVDVPAATRSGVVVMNTPGGSSVTVAEQTFAMMLAMLRHIPAATASVKQGKWEKKRFQGREAAGKTLGVIGIGKIGALVVQRARAFGMNVIAYDPLLSAEGAAKLGARAVELEELFATSDVVSLHVPLTPQTRHLVNEETLAKMKQGSYLVNAARGGIVDEHALARSMERGHLAGAALDVFEEEPPPVDHPLFALENFVCAPHLGASTKEAQEIVATQIAEQLVAYFREGVIRNAVNVPAVSKETLERLGPWLSLAGRLGALVGQLSRGNASRIALEFSGEITKESTRHLSGEVLKGMLPFFIQDPVNEVNAPSLASERGLTITEKKIAESPDYASTIGVELVGEGGSLRVQGSVLGKRDLRIVRIDEFVLDAVPSGHLLLIRNEDVPRIVGQVGMILGDAGINIGRIHLSRSRKSGQALSMINIDSPASEETLAALRAVPHLLGVTPIQL